jgi:hypothetical protein
MSSRERQLAIFMRILGGVTATAIFFVFVPYSVMNTIHDGWLGMGPLPADPIAGYLARSLSAFYAMVGALNTFLSFDVRKYRSVILFHVVFTFVFGVVVFGIDVVEGMPPKWRYGEGPMVIAIGVISYVLWRRAGRSE